MNDNTSCYERETSIQLLDLFATILRHWKLLLIAGLAGILLLGGYQLATDLRAGPQLVMSEDEIEEAQQTIEANEQTIADDRAKLEMFYMELEDLYDAQENYDAVMELAMSVETVDPALVTEILALTEKLASIQSSITAKSDQIAATESEISELQEESDALTEQMNETVSVSAFDGVALKAAIGLIVGVFLACLYLVVRYVLDRRLHTEAGLEDDLGLYLIQSVCLPADSGEERSRYQRSLDRLSGAVPPEEQEQRYEMAAAKIKALAERGKRVVLTGTAREELVAHVYDGLKRHLSDSDLDLVMVEDLKKAPETVAQMSSYQVVLVEGVMDSRVDEIKEVLHFMQISSTKLVGAIAVRKLQ